MRSMFAWIARLSIPVFLSLSALHAQEQTTAPHRSFGIPCHRCHSTATWNYIANDTLFDHSLTGFVLSGAHADVTCRGCHDGRGFKSLAHTCAGCHRDVHRAELGADCERCHTPEAWRDPMRFISMHETTRFPLLGAHRYTDCKACHTNEQTNEYVSVSVECATCHRGDYNTALNPRHTLPAFTLQCDQCHDQHLTAWSPARFTHSSFPLLGAHASLQCGACHNGGFSGASVNCYDCHRDAYMNAASPNHVSGNFPTNCSVCHSTVSWRPAQFNHDITGFPLTGGHANVDCARCHPGGQYTAISTDCVSCHLKDYQTANNPPHANVFPQTCATCHTVQAWSPATFDHAKTQFPLTGAHAQQPCTACHRNNQWTGLSTDCYACHAADFANATSPNHATANFPHDCTPCHTTTAWQPSTFNHDPLFPIYSGSHRRAWTSCEDCHISPSNYRQFTCTLCHEHANKASLDSEHRGVQGYSYTDSECYRCHPTGRGG